MNNETSSRIWLISVCQYITTLGVTFNSKGLIAIDQRNQTSPSFNALSEYLNESLAIKNLGQDLEDGHFLKRSKRQPSGSAKGDWSGTTRDSMPRTSADVTLGTSEEASSSVYRHHLRFEPKHPTDYNFVRTLRDLRDKGLTAVKQNAENMKHFRWDLNRMALSQINKNFPQRMNIKLWCSQKTYRSNIVQYLKNQEGQQFFFNDITLLTRINDEQLPWKVWRPYEAYDFVYEIYYYITIFYEYGFVRVEEIKNFPNHYITFPDVLFKVTRIETVRKKNKEILIMYLSNYFLSRLEWRKNVEKQSKLLATTESGKSERLQSIEKAADLITSIVPMHTFGMSVNILKDYILKSEESTTSVPTYKELAWDICNNLNISAFYNKWKIPRNMFIDDVLFGTDFDTSMSYLHLLTKMNIVYLSNHLRFNETEYNKYKNSSLLRNSLRIEDYFILKQFLQSESEHRTEDSSMKRLFVAMYRLALKECEEEWIENNITVHHVTHEGNYRFLKAKLNSNHNYTLRTIAESSSHFAVEEYKLSNMPSMQGMPIWMEIEFSNQAGIVSIDRLFDNYRGRYIIFPNTFPVIEHRFTEIASNDVLFIKMEDKRSKESKMIEMIKNLYGILTKFPHLFSYYD